uniref:Rab-GAP TBC domain-containing protein n=1 Tax=Aegilops tauschii subsp. strangulata TaxID=200361 RepID=A0A453BUD2_AEGTS
MLLTQEFKFRDCIHLWDALLGDPEGPQGHLVKDLLCNANSCSKTALGWRLHCKPQASPELPTHKH